MAVASSYGRGSLPHKTEKSLGRETTVFRQTTMLYSRKIAGIAQLVERLLPKQKAAGPSPVSRSLRKTSKNFQGLGESCRQDG